MQPKPLKRLWGLLTAATVAFLLVGCRGADGQNGANGTNGSNGSDGTPGSSYAMDATTFTPEEWSNLTLKATITSVTMGGAPVVNFKVVDGHNVAVKGLGFTSQTATAQYASYANMAFSIAKLIPAVPSGPTEGPSRWVSYVVTSNPTASAPNVWNPTRPSTDNIGTLTDNGDGTYRYTFRRDITQTQANLDAYTGYNATNVKADLDDVSYNPNYTHRITLYVGGTARNTGTNTSNGANSGVPSVPILNPANAVYDFVPATGLPVTAANEQREIVDTSACFSCHAKFEFHGGGRQDTRYCVVCHNDQRKYGFAEATTTATGFDVVAGQRKIQNHAVGDFPSFIHKLHMGEELSKDGYNYANVKFNEITYPQDHRNCVKCHTASTATPQGDNWFNKPTRFACGGCHDDVKWSDGTNHPGGLQTADNACTGCHTPADIKSYHLTVVAPDPNNVFNGGTNNNTNASWVAAYPNNLPPGAKRVTWDLNSVTINASQQPVFKFRFMVDGVPQVFNTYDLPGGVTEMMSGFVGGPSAYLAMALPQDGIDTPADWNATVSTYIKNIWRGDHKTPSGGALPATQEGTLTFDAASGYYTLTLTGVIIPTTATHITGGIGYTYGLTNTQPLTQIDVPNVVVGGNTIYDFTYAPATKQGGVAVPAPNVTKLVGTIAAAGFGAQTARRTIVANQKCNDCHGALGVFTSKAYHAGQRNDANTCEFCHNGGRVNSGWGVNMKDFVHAIHGASKRENKFSWEFASTGAKYWEITYPGVLNNCEACHVPGSYDFSNSNNAKEVDNLCWTTVATGTTPATVNVVTTGDELQSGGPYYSPWVTPSTTYGSAFAFNAAAGTTTQAAGTTLVNSPYVAACSNCHDSSIAIAHMKTNGGTFYNSRVNVKDPVSGKFIVQEQCFLCHSSGKIADVKVVHAFK